MHNTTSSEYEYRRMADNMIGHKIVYLLYFDLKISHFYFSTFW